MSEWVSVLAVFWVLWAIDGARLNARRVFIWVGSTWNGKRARVSFSRFSRPGWWPSSWRVTGSDVPVSLSPAGICNVVVGAAGRPAERDVEIQLWRWDEVRDVGVARGWIYMNGRRFCPDTGHLKAAELLDLARRNLTQREQRIRRLIDCWTRPSHLARRLTVLKGRTSLAVEANIVAWVGWFTLTLYIVGDFATRLPGVWSERLVQGLPFVLLGLVGLHMIAVVAAWRAMKRLKPVMPEKRGTALLSAFLLPPQALRLRALAGEGFFPAQHPIAPLLVFATGREREEPLFHVLADLRWPLTAGSETGPVGDVTSWFRAALEQRILGMLGAAKIDPAAALVEPRRDSPASCSYCPRCRAQFVDQRALCPNGVPLRPLTRR